MYLSDMFLNNEIFYCNIVKPTVFQFLAAKLLLLLVVDVQYDTVLDTVLYS